MDKSKRVSATMVGGPRDGMRVELPAHVGGIMVMELAEDVRAMWTVDPARAAEEVPTVAWWVPLVHEGLELVPARLVRDEKGEPVRFVPALHVGWLSLRWDRRSLRS